MRIGAAMFFTDYSMRPADLARAMEERGFESVWAPEHSHIPLSRKSPFPSGGELPRQYYDVMDPFVSLSAAAAVTNTIKIGSGVCLIIQRDTIQTAHSGEGDRPFRPKVITGSGDRDHADHGR
jgi:alkanesulfonate monooxygenase SsuD/methylene tetrahydromethanopterin reductase-like flavin-dependent oxidoreductase (luciferase family)